MTSLGVLLGAGGVALGFQAADPIVGLVITVAIVFVLKDAARSIYYRLMDAVDPELVERARSVAGSVPGVQRVDELRLRWIGHRLHAEAEVTVDPHLRSRTKSTTLCSTAYRVSTKSSCTRALRVTTAPTPIACSRTIRTISLTTTGECIVLTA